MMERENPMKINPEKIWARSLAAMAIGAATVALAGCSLLGQVGGGTGTDDGGTGEGTDTDAFSIKVGDCLNDASVAEEVTSVPVIECSEAHDSEAYASIIMPDGDFPGDDAVTTAAEDGCLAEFEGYVGIPYEESALEISYYFPTEASWGNGDREILCTVYDPNGQSTGSAQGTSK
jgi:hypothetical protein